MIAKIKKFLNEVIIELKKVAWSTRTELMGATASVFVLVIILAVFIGFCDIVLSKIIDLVIRYSL
ncbi:MAG: preprotein translocase subunit SecE [Candidatus Omnitrophica bacterium]|nr:preprotein translocase subunit SecE [Candidatus Omnitrophota bacterium]